MTQMSVGDNRIYLASRSPRRRELLKQIGVSFESLLLREDLRRGVDVDETPLPDESPGIYALRIARAKAAIALQQIAQRALPQKPVLAADTTVVFDDRIIGKPEDDEDAARHPARALGPRAPGADRGGARAAGPDRNADLGVERVVPRARRTPRSGATSRAGEPLDKAGAYAIQGRARGVRHADRGQLL